MSRRIALVAVWLVAIGLWTEVYFSRQSEPKDFPQSVYLDGKPISFYVEGLRTTAEESPDKTLTRGEVLERVKATSPGNPIGRGDQRRLKPFRYFYNEVLPGTLSTEADLVALAMEMSDSLEREGSLHGRPFVFIPSSGKGALFSETFRVCLPVSDSVRPVSNMKEGRFDGAMVALNLNGVIGQGGDLGEMKRWAESVPRSVSGAGPASSGPLFLRLGDRDPDVAGGVAWEWMIPIGPLPGTSDAVDRP